MKSPKFLLSALALTISIASFSQTDTTKKDTTTKKTDTIPKTPTSLSENAATGSAEAQPATITGGSTNSVNTGSITSEQPGSGSNNSATVPVTGNAAATALAAAPKANFGRYYIPVLGSYQSNETTAENKVITVSGDESNPGKIWIDGLAETRVYALLKTVPGTYKIPAQKNDNGKVAEGTVNYNEDTKEISVCLGCGYKDQADVESASVASANEVKKTKKTTPSAKKSKVQIISFTGTKSDQGTVSILQ